MNTLKKRWLLLPFMLLCLALLGGCGSRRIYFPYQADRPAYSSELGHKIAMTAKGQIGRPYRYGGSSPSTGFDCSGLIWWVYRTHGISVPRVSSGQASFGRKVSLANAQPGDILVFQTGHSSGGLHTGIYLGASRFVHSPSSGKRVREDSLSAQYWRPRLVAVRRIRG